MKGFLKFALLVSVILALMLSTVAYGAYRLFVVGEKVAIAATDKWAEERVTVWIPAGLFSIALGIVDCGLDRDVRVEIDGEDWRPVIRALAQDLDRYPDMTILEVEDDLERVRIVKENGELRILVESPDAEVAIDVPPALVSKVARLGS
jgi:hypothetical protein